MTMRNEHLSIQGMHCGGCETTIENALAELPGVREVKASYAQGVVDLVFDDAAIRLKGIESTLRQKGYSLAERKPSRLTRMLLNWVVFPSLLVAVVAVTMFGKSHMGVLQHLDARLDYAMLAGIGFLTGFHCIGMCGAFVVGYAVPQTPRRPWAEALAHLFYAGGKTASYAVIGAAFGLFGSLVAITPQMRGTAALASGVFLVLFGLRMLNLFDVLRRVGLPMPRFLARQVSGELRKRRHPLMVGLLSGLLIGCGPLQAMYVLAAGTASPIEGAKLLVFFGLGTLPPLLGFGMFAALIPRLAMQQLVRASGVLVIVMGLMMTDRGLRMTDSGYDFATVISRITGAPPPERVDSMDAMHH